MRRSSTLSFQRRCRAAHDRVEVQWERAHVGMLAQASGALKVVTALVPPLITAALPPVFASNLCRGWRWVAPSLRLFAPDRLREQTVHLEELDRRATSGRKPLDSISPPPKVGPPSVAPRMVDWRRATCPRVDSVASCALPQRTRHASEGQILQFGGARVNERDDMIDVTFCFLSVLSEPAVFAPPPCAKHNRSPQRRRNGHLSLTSNP